MLVLFLLLWETWVGSHLSKVVCTSYWGYGVSLNLNLHRCPGCSPSTQDMPHPLDYGSNVTISFFQRVPKPLCVINAVPSSQRRMPWRHTDRPILVSVPDSIPQTTKYYIAQRRSRYLVTSSYCRTRYYHAERLCGWEWACVDARP